MANRFSSQQDYSQTFQYLYDQNQRYLESAAQRVDSAREAELAARDSLIFTKWQEGKISGNELMAHINARMRATSYDKAQQLQWREAAIKYGNVIADERAEAAYAQSDNINALIIHYSRRLAGAKQGTPERRELAERLKTLRDTRDRNDLSKQARRINRAIKKGTMSKRDLLAFYRGKISSGEVTGELKQDVLDQIAELRGQIRDEDFDVAMTRIDTVLESGSITPQEAASQKAEVLKRFDTKRLEPAQFAEWQQHIQQLRATPDPAEIQRLQFLVASDQMSPEAYVARLNRFADAIAPFDMQGSWELRREAQNFLESNATPLEEGLLERANAASGPYGEGGSRGYQGVVDVVTKLRGRAIKHITQMDSSKYSQYNCTMASGAMLAYAMGVRAKGGGIITGADLRSMSGVTSQATNIQQLQSALQSAGVDGTRLNWDDRIEFEKFKKRVSNGAPAVLSGWLGDIPQQFNTSGFVTGHAMFVAGYDAKRDAFLMLDPAKSKDSGTWWPSSILQDFGWGGQRHGQALFAPPNTIDPKTLQRVGGKVQHIAVTAAPANPQASPIKDRTDPGPDNYAESLSKAINETQKARLRDAGIKAGKKLDTKQEVKAAIDRRIEKIDQIKAVADEWTLLAEAGAMDEDGYVALQSNGQRVSRDEIADLQKQLIYLYDGQMILYKAIGSRESVGEMRRAKNQIIVDAAVVNSLDWDYSSNRVLGEMRNIFSDMAEAKSPAERMALLNEAMETAAEVTAIREAQTEQVARAPVPGQAGSDQEVTTPADKEAARIDSVTSPETGLAQSEWSDVLDFLASVNEYETAEEFVSAADELMGLSIVGDGTGPDAEAIAALIKETAAQKMVETGEGGWVLIGDKLEVISTIESGEVDPETGEPILKLDLERDLMSSDDPGAQALYQQIIEMGYDGTNLPPASISGEDVVFVPEPVAYPGVTFLEPNIQEIFTSSAQDELTSGVKLVLDRLEGVEGLEDALLNGVALPPDVVDSLSPSQVRMLISMRVLNEAPFAVQSKTFDGVTYYRDEMPTADGGMEFSWHAGSLPGIPYNEYGEGADKVASRYYGVDPENPRQWPVVTFDPDDTMDDADMGTQLPTWNMAPEQARRATLAAIQAGIISPVNFVRNPENPSIAAPAEAGKPGSPDYAGATTMDKYISDFNKAKSELRNRLVTVVPQSVAEDMPFMSDNDVSALEQEYFGKHGAIPLMTPLTGVLDDLGIKTKEDEQEAEAPARFDPLAGLEKMAYGAARYNAMKRAQDKAAALDRARAAAQARASALPKIAPPAGTGPEPSLPKPYQARPRATGVPQVPTPKPPSGPPKRTSTMPKLNESNLQHRETTTPTAPKTYTTQPRKPRAV